MRRGVYIPLGCDQQGRWRPGIYSHDSQAEQLDPPPGAGDVLALVVCGLVSLGVVVGLASLVLGAL